MIDIYSGVEGQFITLTEGLQNSLRGVRTVYRGMSEEPVLIEWCQDSLSS